MARKSLDLSKIEIHPKEWGSELWIANNEHYCGKILELKEGLRCSIHFHKKKDETFFILEGIVLMEAYDNAVIMKHGDALRIIPGTKHRFTGLKDSKILEISTHHEESDSYRDVKSGRVPDDEFKEMQKMYVHVK